MKNILICTDLDRTLIPNGPHPESSQARPCFKKLVARDEVTLAYVTGRDRDLVEDAIANYGIPVPDYVIADVGSTIYRVNHHQWTNLLSWEEKISTDWQNKSSIEIRSLLDGFDELTLQEQSKQGHHKLSYYVSLNDENESLVKRVKKTLSEAGYHSSVVWSIDDIEAIGLLDILPGSASKKHAIEFLMQLLNFDRQQTVFAGDSGNDINVLVSPINAVLVANATGEVKKAASSLAMKNNQQDSLYIASGDFMGMNGNYSAGILEGIVHYLPATGQWI